MGNNHPIQIAILVGILMVGGILFAMMITVLETIPTEYRNASPGFGWSWDFDFEDAMANAGRLGEQPFPWQAAKTGSSWLLPLNQPLRSKGLEITYRGMTASGRISLNVTIQSLDPSTAYPRDLDVMNAKRGFSIAGQPFTLETIAPLYIRLCSMEGTL